MKKLTLFLLLLLLTACGGNAEENYTYEPTQPPTTAGLEEPPSGYFADALRLVAIVEDVHPIFILPHLLPDYYEARRAEFLAAAARPDMTQVDFGFAMQRYFTALHDGHMSMPFVRMGGYLNIGLIYDSGRLFLHDQRAVEVVSIGGVDAGEMIGMIDGLFFFENEFARRVMIPRHAVSGAMLMYAGVDVAVPWLYVTVVENGVQSEKQVHFSQNPTFDPPNYIIRHEMMGDVFFISLRQFVDGDHITEAAEAIEAAMADGINKFIVDLRGNSGGNSTAGMRLVNAMGMTLPSFGSLRRLSELASEQRGIPFSETIDRIETHPIPSMGSNPKGVQLAVLVDNFSFSSAVMMAAWVQDGGLGTVVGEPPMNAPSAFGDMLVYNLPYVDLNVPISYTRFTRPNLNDDQNVLWPDILVDAGDALEAALDFLN